MTIKIKMTEHELQTALMNLLTFRGIYCWRNNSGMIATGEGRYRRMIRMGTAGMPDILGVFGGKWGNNCGRLLGIEVKLPKNKPTFIQAQVHEELRSHGAIVWVIHSIDELEKALALL